MVVFIVFVYYIEILKSEKSFKCNFHHLQSCTQVFFFSSAAQGTNPLVVQDGVIRVKPKSKMNHKIAFPIKRQRLAISLTSRFQPFPGVGIDWKEKLHSVTT